MLSKNNIDIQPDKDSGQQRSYISIAKIPNKISVSSSNATNIIPCLSWAECHVSPSPPIFLLWSPTLKCNTWRWAFMEVIKVKWGYKSPDPIRFTVLIREGTGELICSFFLIYVNYALINDTCTNRHATTCILINSNNSILLFVLPVLPLSNFVSNITSNTQKV